jgi:hypothetical protein
MRARPYSSEANPFRGSRPLSCDGGEQAMLHTNGSLDRLILVYDGDSGLRAMLLDMVKKCAGREDCALCEITYSPLGQRSSFRACKARLGVAVEELHRDQLPADWGISRAQLPCILGCTGTERPVVLVPREEIIACRGRMNELEAKLLAALSNGASLRSAARSPEHAPEG